MARNLIIIGGGTLQMPLIDTAKAMGLFTIVFDMTADAPGMKAAHMPVIMSTRDIDGCVREARRLRETMQIHGVVTAGTDASRAVAAIAGSLDLPGIRYADSEAASNKVLMRKRLRQHGVPIPDFRSVWSIKEAREAMDEMTFPLVLKPADNMGARGVIKISAREEIYAAFKHAKKHSPTGEMILEEYMEGPELSIDALAWNGQIRMTGIADRIIAREPYFVELGHNMPSSLPASVIEEAADVMKAGMRALGIHTGAGKGDIKLAKLPPGQKNPRHAAPYDNYSIKVGEIAARLSGGYMSSHTYPLHSGVNLHKAAVQIALGDEPSSLEETKNFVAIERGILSRPGKILELNGVAEMNQVPKIEHIVFTRKPGDVVVEATSNLDKIGHIIACAPTLEEAEAAAQECLKRVQISVDDTFSVDWKSVEDKARERFGDQVCWVCKSCAGHCASGVPGMGGLGSMNTFKDNAAALAEIRIIPRYIRTNVQPDTTLEFLGRKFETPIMAAPMTGTATNMRNAIGEYDLARILVHSSREAGSIAWVGDGATPDRYKTIFKALAEADGVGIAICKPRSDEAALLERFRVAEELGLTAIGMDIDAISFRTMELKRLGSTARNFEALRMLRDSVNLPFILKGIMSPEDAEEAIRAGVSALVVSNHGGRVLDDMPGTARVLPEIVSVVAGRIPVLVDGGIRTGQDVFKMLALGANGVLVGRPLAIAAVGGDLAAVKFLYSRMRDELARTMNLCGTERLTDIDQNFIRIYRESDPLETKNRG
ncbi:MAG: alpha-hydroxy-acid oxidizing protein [Leptospirales bacterium]|nr:alpha-hydroxy-acid oxidizing protein [Leptospirales bacterium]